MTAELVTAGVSDASYTLTLKRGWNLVSTPIYPEDPTPESCFAVPQGRSDQSPPIEIWAWDGDQYVKPPTSARARATGSAYRRYEWR